MAIESEPLFSPIKTTDDSDDDEENIAIVAYGDGGPGTTYHDDPQPSSSPSTPSRSRRDRDAAAGPETRYRDEPDDSVFDWGGDNNNGDNDNGNSNSSAGEKASNSATKKKKSSSRRGGEEESSDMYRIEDRDNDFDFSPVSLHDDDSDDDEENNNNNGSSTNNDNGNGKDNITGKGKGKGGDDNDIRLKANKLLNERIFDDTAFDDTNERIFVGGGWGRHGSQFSWCPHGFCAWCCRGNKPPSYSRGPPKTKSRAYGLCQMVCVGIVFCVVVFGAGYVGYEAGLPVDGALQLAGGNNLAENATEGEGTDSVNDDVVHHTTHTKGEEWLQWLEQEKQEIHLPHWNFTIYNPHHKHMDKFNSEEVKGAIFKKSNFEPMTQSDLLHVSESIVQACSERSLKTDTGRNACMSHCHGHYCCFEKDLAFGSCVAEDNSYCFAYAACENLVIDFEMNNANTVPKDEKNQAQANAGQIQMSVKQGHGTILNVLDVKLLQDTCSKDNIATLEGIRDCTAFCQHHLCCFNELEEENCAKDFPGECQAYDSCGILVDGPEDVEAGMAIGDSGGGGGSLAAAGGGGGGVTSHTFKADCMNSNLHENWDLCKNHCTRYECCFRQEDSCYQTNTLECDEYYICEEFYTEFEQQPAKVGGSSSSNQVVGNTNDAVYGTIHKPAASSTVHYDSAGDVNAGISTAVEAVCSAGEDHPADDSWVTACHALCANYLCCFSQTGTESNCRDTYGKELCLSYLGCQVLTAASTDFRPTSGSNDDYRPTLTTGSHDEPETNWNSADEEILIDQQVKDVNDFCTPQARSDSWLNEKCQKACVPRSCCFRDGPGDCSIMNEDWCSEFEACELLYT